MQAITITPGMHPEEAAVVSMVRRRQNAPQVTRKAITQRMPTNRTRKGRRQRASMAAAAMAKYLHSA